MHQLWLSKIQSKKSLLIVHHVINNYLLFQFNLEFLILLSLKSIKVFDLKSNWLIKNFFEFFYFSKLNCCSISISPYPLYLLPLKKWKNSCLYIWLIIRILYLLVFKICFYFYLIEVTVERIMSRKRKYSSNIKRKWEFKWFEFNAIIAYFK